MEKQIFDAIKLITMKPNSRGFLFSLINFLEKLPSGSGEGVGEQGGTNDFKKEIFKKNSKKARFCGECEAGMPIKFLKDGTLWCVQRSCEVHPESSCK